MSDRQKIVMLIFRYGKYDLSWRNTQMVKLDCMTPEDHDLFVTQFYLLYHNDRDAALDLFGSVPGRHLDSSVDWESHKTINKMYELITQAPDPGGVKLR